jgi:hypothetical protein
LFSFTLDLTPAQISSLTIPERTRGNGYLPLIRQKLARFCEPENHLLPSQSSLMFPIQLIEKMMIENFSSYVKRIIILVFY